MPETRRALETGDVSITAAGVLAGARDVDVDAFGRDEGVLVGAARAHSVGGLHRVVGY